MYSSQISDRIQDGPIVFDECPEDSIHLFVVNLHSLFLPICPTSKGFRLFSDFPERNRYISSADFAEEVHQF
jgi:hypothetical protein